ncbi:MAG: cyclase family protein [Gemmatimonadetes bacterium]|nr:cyclase family protein [Gemmatimonadota bacterium]
MADQHRFVDVSHAVEHGMITYRGLPGPVISDYLTREASEARYAPGVGFHISRIDMVANTGTYIDSPFHRYAAGVDLAGLELDSVAAVPGVVVRAAARDDRAIGRDAFGSAAVAGRAVLVETGWDAHWNSDEYYEGYPFLTADAASYLVDAGAKVVGIDSLNIDDDQDGQRPVHSALLEAGIPVVEHLCNLAELPDTGFAFFAVPVAVKGMGSFPVRAFALLDQ